MRLNVKTKIFGAYLLVLGLGAVLSVLVYGYGRDVLDASRRLAQEDVPRLQDISALKVNILNQEKVLYEYYAIRDRKSFLQKYALIDNVCMVGLDAIAKPFKNSDKLDAVRGQYNRLRALALQLDETLKAGDVDPGKARLLLFEISAAAQGINHDLDGLAGQIQTRVQESGRSSNAAVHLIRTVVIAFCAIIFIVALLVGFYVRSYLAEHAERRRLAMFPERNPNPILRLALSGEIVYANPSATKLLTSLDADPENPRTLLPDNVSDRLATLRESNKTHEVWEYQIGERTFQCDIHLLHDLDTFHVYISDITERNRAQGQLVHQAYHDALTGLPNRRMFQEQLEHVLHTTDRGGMRAAVLLTNLDRFNVVIGSLGHGVGDTLLQVVAARLERVLKESRDVCANAALFHFGGDGFAVLIPESPKSETPVTLAQGVLTGAQTPVYVNGRELFITFSIGMSVFPLDGQDPMTLLKNADTAMQQVKHRGGNGFQPYNTEMNARALEWLSLENHLRHALEYRELQLRYQPQVDIRTGRVIGAEALLRWHHPTRGRVPPGEFIPLAEESGIILPLGEWILRSACAAGKAWRDRGLGAVTVAVNISARQFHNQDLPRIVAETLNQTGLPAQNLELEITESVAMQDLEFTIATLHELKAIGVKLSLDDFGTGFSSLSYLKRFPIDKLKIDQSFIRNLTIDDNDAAITLAVITLAHNLKLRVNAEGVETAAQLAALRRDECDEYQGYLYSKPVTAEQFEALIANNHSIRTG